MCINKKIAWEKFTPIYELNNLPEDDSHEEDIMEERDEDDDEGEENNINPASFLNIDELLARRKVRTPFGVYDIDDDFSPYNMFDCWIGHTNFRLTKKDFNILDNQIDGIGCLKVLSPYRFFIGIEKMFSFPTVRIQIQKDLCNNLEINDNILPGQDVDEIINSVLSRINEALFSIKGSEKWAIFIGMDGTIEAITEAEFDSSQEYENNLTSLKSLKNGNIITFESM